VVTRTPVRGCYDPGSQVTLTASPTTGFSFDQWSGDAGGSANPLVVTMDGPKNITAQFIQPPPSCGDWRQVYLENGDLPLYVPAAALDPVRHRLLALGTSIYTLSGLELWELSLATPDADWHPVPMPAPPFSYRYNFTMIYDPVRDRLLLYGGSDNVGTSYGDVWALQLGGSLAWTQLVPEAGPAIRLFNTFTYDPVRDRAIVFGGWSNLNGESFGD